MKKLFRNFIESRRALSLNALIVTASRGFGSISLLKTLAGSGVRAVMVIPQHQNRCHPSVGGSLLSASRGDDSKNCASESDGSYDDGDTNDRNSSTVAATRDSVTEGDDDCLGDKSIAHRKWSFNNDRRAGLIIKNNGNTERTTLFAKKQIRTDCSGQ